MPDPFNIKTIFDTYHHKVYWLALSITRNESDAEDVVQNTFLKIVKNLKNFRRESSLSTWIYKIAYNEALMYLRKRQSLARLTDYVKEDQVKTPTGLVVNWSKIPDREALEGELAKRVDEALKGMPIKYRMPLMLNGVEGIDVKDAARILGLKANSVKTRLHRARAFLHQEISNYAKDHAEKHREHDKACDLSIDFVYRYAGGGLNKRTKSEFKRRIGDCPACKSFLHRYTKAVNITKALECQDLPKDLRDRIETLFLSRHFPSSARKKL